MVLRNEEFIQSQLINNFWEFTDVQSKTEYPAISQQTSIQKPQKEKTWPHEKSSLENQLPKSMLMSGWKISNQN